MQNPKNRKTGRLQNDPAEEQAAHFSDGDYKLNAQLIRVRMKELGLTLTDLQQHTSVAYRTLYRWLGGEDFPRKKNIAKLADILQLEPEQLFIQKYTSRLTAVRDELLFVQRQIEQIVSQTLSDEKVPDEKKLDLLLKYHNMLLKTNNQKTP